MGASEKSRSHKGTEIVEIVHFLILWHFLLEKTKNKTKRNKKTTLVIRQQFSLDAEREDFLFQISKAILCHTQIDHGTSNAE